MQRCLVMFSGGQDSTTLAQWAKNKFDFVSLIAFDYHQKHQVELQQARIIANKLHLDLKIVKLDFLGDVVDSALISSHLQDINAPHQLQESLPASFVPNRNAMFITIAHALAQKMSLQNLAIGVSQQDYSGYPDCHKNFITAIELALNLGAKSQIVIHTPFIDMDKAQEFKLAQELGILEMVLEDTHTCYEGVRDIRHVWGYGCGRCNACLLRKNAYEKFLSYSDII